MAEVRYVFKMAVVGDTGAGKSQLVDCYSKGFAFNESHYPTVGVDFGTRVVELKDDKAETKTEAIGCKLQIWDTAGQERFRTISTMYYRGTKAFILAYDVARRDTFLNIHKVWLPEIRKYAEPGAVIFIVGNKADLAHEVKRSEGEEFVKQLNAAAEEEAKKIAEKLPEDEQQKAMASRLFYFHAETSAKKNLDKNLDKLFESVTRQLYNHNPDLKEVVKAPAPAPIQNITRKQLADQPGLLPNLWRNHRAKTLGIGTTLLAAAAASLLFIPGINLAVGFILLAFAAAVVAGVIVGAITRCCYQPGGSSIVKDFAVNTDDVFYGVGDAPKAPQSTTAGQIAKAGMFDSSVSSTPTTPASAASAPPAPTSGTQPVIQPVIVGDAVAQPESQEEPQTEKSNTM